MPAASCKGPIAKRVIAALRKQSMRKVVDIEVVRQAKSYAAELDASVVTNDELAAMDPVHAVYIQAQNQLSVIAEQLVALPALERLTTPCAEAEDLYLPSGPPMSPLTTSYFFCWGTFDLVAGVKKESLGSVCIDLGRALGMNAELLHIFTLMQASRMGIYVHEGTEGHFVLLREIFTNVRVKAISPSGYLGQPGELWYVRILPEPFPELGLGYSVVFTTPYVLLADRRMGGALATEQQWLDFVHRSLEHTGKKDQNRAFEHLMKYGLDRLYWNEFVFEAYVNHRHEMIWLQGLPDDDVSRPLSDKNMEAEW